MSTTLTVAPGTRLSIQDAHHDITNMYRNGSTLVINTTDGNQINVQNFFDTPEKGLSSLVVSGGIFSGEDQKIVLGDADLYADGSEVVPRTPEEMKALIASKDYYQERAEEAGAGNEDDKDNNGGFLALGILGGVGAVGLAAWGISNHNKKGGSDHHDDKPTPPAPEPKILTVNPTNGSSLSGTTDTPNTKVYIEIDGKTHEVMSDNKGNWKLEFDTKLPDGTPAHVWVNNSAGEKVAEVNIVVDGKAPEFESIVVPPEDGKELSGVTEPGAKVTVDLDGDGKRVYTTTADAKGNWKIEFKEGDSLVPGTSTISAEDNVGNVSTATVPKGADPSILGISHGDGPINMDGTNVHEDAVLNGRGLAGSTVEVLSDGKVIGTAKVGADGKWQLSLDGIDAGSHKLSVRTSKVGDINFQIPGDDKDVNLVADTDLTRPTENNDAIDSPVAVTRSMPGGGYLIAYASQESPGSEFYDIKVKIYGPDGSLVKEVTVGQQGSADGYFTSGDQDHLRNFDVAVDPKDGTISVVYVQGYEKNHDSYTENNLVYERFDSNGAPLTDGPQLLNKFNDYGGLDGILKGVLPDGLANVISGVVKTFTDFVNAFDGLAGVVGIDLEKLTDLFTNGIANRIIASIISSGRLGTELVQMDDGSLVVMGTINKELGNLEHFVDRVDIGGFIKELLSGLGIEIGIVNGLIDAISDIADGALNLITDWLTDGKNLMELGSSLYSLRLVPNEKGELVPVSNLESPEDMNLISSILEKNGYISGTHTILEGVIDSITGSQTRGDSLGLDGVAIGDGKYAVIWQTAGTSEVIDNLLKAKISLEMAIVDSKTGKVEMAPVEIDTPDDKHAVAPKIVQLASGEVIVTWVQMNKDDGGDVWMQRFRYAGGKLVAQNDAEQINTGAEGTQGLLPDTLKGAYDVVALENGGYVVSWLSTEKDGSQQIITQVYDVAGNKTSEEIHVNTSNEGGIPSVTALDDGGFVISWNTNTGNGEDGVSGNIYHQVYNQDGSLRATGESGDHSSDLITGNMGQDLTGTENADVIDARNGAGKIDSHGGDDRILISEKGFEHIDGGDGFNTLVFSGQDKMTVGSDLLSKVEHINELQFGKNGGDLNINYEDLVKLNDEKELFVSGDGDSVVHMNKNEWHSTGVIASKGGAQYDLYVYQEDPQAEIWVQHNISVV
ncbi:Ig-like domain-containing protein [Enterobacter sp. CC120223-11]|uniref:Ig-like domain-containing protein n=1 Tax=Enterobacter sp. CC120223-11 TaxID=1378073 RepID=UPI001596D7E0|nr:Ig-like domain-containing protein [Enterobacter sp. CC120223-11]